MQTWIDIIKGIRAKLIYIYIYIYKYIYIYNFLYLNNILFWKISIWFGFMPCEFGSVFHKLQRSLPKNVWANIRSMFLLNATACIVERNCKHSVLRDVLDFLSFQKINFLCRWPFFLRKYFKKRPNTPNFLLFTT